MYNVKNLTNSPYRISTADGGFGILMARGEGDFDIHPMMLNSYKQLGYMVITEICSQEKPVPSSGKEEVHEDAQNSGLSEDAQKEALIAELAELGVKADKRSSVEKLQERLDEALAE